MSVELGLILVVQVATLLLLDLKLLIVNSLVL